MDQNTPKGALKKPVAPRKTWRNRLVVLIAVVLLLPLLLSMVLHIPFVQNKVIQVIASNIEKRIEQKVDIDFVDFSIFSGLRLEGFDVISLDGRDTIIGTQSLNISLSRNLLSIVQGELAIQAIQLEGPKIHITKEENAAFSNLEILLKKLTTPPKSETGKGGLKISLNQIDIADLSYRFDHRPKGQLFQIEAGRLFVHVDKIDLDSTTFIIDDLELKDLLVSIDQYRLPLPMQMGSSKEDTMSVKEGPEILVKRFSLYDGALSIRNSFEQKPSTVHFDVKNFDLLDIQALVENFSLNKNGDLAASISRLSLFDDKGFELKELATPKFEFTQESIFLNQFTLSSDRSYLETDLLLQFRNRGELNDVLNRGIIEADVIDSYISVEDLVHFIPDLGKSKLVADNLKMSIGVEGTFSGRISNLKGQDVFLSLPGIMEAEGNFGTRNLGSNNPLINLKLQQLNTSINGLKKLLPSFRPPENFEKLGKIQFTGSFDGYLNDFVAYGLLNSELGQVRTDMRLDLKSGAEQAAYSGDITLINFDLNRWTGSDDFGYINFEGVVANGRGLTKTFARADLEGSLKSFDFKGYVYKNINVNGIIDKNKFDGKISSSDLNFNFGFDGFAEFLEEGIGFDFKADVGIIDFQALNLSEKPLTFRGNLDFKGQGQNLNDLVGKIQVFHMNIQKEDSILILDSIIVHSFMEDESKNLKVLADGSSIHFKGRYDINTVVDDFKSILKINFPYHLRQWDYTPKPISNSQNFQFDVSLKNNKPIFDLLGLSDNMQLDTLYAKGSVNSSIQEINLVTTLPRLGIGKNKFHEVSLSLSGMGNRANVDLQVDDTYLGNTHLRAIDIGARVQGDNAQFVFDTENVLDSLQKLELSGSIEPFQNGYTIRLDENEIRIYNKKWKINSDNEISLDKNYIEITNFTITDGQRLIEIDDINRKGLRLNVSKFDLELFNHVLKDDKFYFSGEAFANVRISDIYKKSPDVYANFLMPNMKINGDSYGELNIDLSKPLDKPFDVIVSFNNDENGQAIKAVGKIDLETKKVEGEIKAKKVPLKIVEYILVKGIENVEGYADLDGKISGTYDALKINSRGIAHKSKVRVKALGETYSFDKQNFKITESRIDLNGAIIKDSQGGTAVVSGGLNHTLFKDFYLDAYLQGNNVIALNTTKYDNPVYYGFGKGDVEVEFTGSVNYPNLKIDARTRNGTEIFIPIQSTQSESDRSFITFIDKKSYFGEDTNGGFGDQVRIDGLSIEMNLVMTPAAEVQLIFDEVKGDIIRANGDGNLQINMNRNGDFDIFGDYEVREGEYLFTAFNFVNKPFSVREGGRVRWTGDPINATLDLKADYQVRTDLNTFLAEYLVTPALEQAASNRTEVNLQMNITNTLYNPAISFGLEFPDLTGDLKSYADSKVRLLQNNQNDLNSQVFSLIVFNSFLPTNTLSQVLTSGTFFQSASISTLSEFVSNQLSSYVTRFINESLEENGLISGVDFDINFRNNLSVQGIETNEFSILPTEIEVKLKNKFRFLDERLSFDLGGNYVRESLIGLNNYIVPEFVFRYALTADRRLNLKVYGKYDLDEISVNNRRQRLGVGLRYRTEFGSMLETKNKIRKSIIRIDDEES